MKIRLSKVCEKENEQSFKRHLKRCIANVLFCFFLLLFGVQIINFTSFVSFYVPSDSMQPTLLPGDNILVNKWIMGARIFDIRGVVEKKELDVYRLPGIGKVKRGDVLVFNFPYPHRWDSISMSLKLYYVKRCAALPGDTFAIRDAPYHEGMVLKSYPNDSLVDWTVCNFGPMYIPKKGGNILMDAKNRIIYRNVIEWEQKKKLTLQDGNVCLGDSIIHEYSFTENYYFMTGDNVANSQDSRYWGLLPEPFIVGKATTIWKSVNPATDEIRWDRTMKSIE